MAAGLSQDAVLGFLRSNGGSVKNSDLLLHFRNFLRNHADRDRNREAFKRFVNTLATVRQEDGVSYVVLRKKFRGHVPGDRGGGGGGGGSVSPQTHLSPTELRAEKTRTQAQPREETVPAPPGGTAVKTILPAAGIINNNNNMETNLNLKRKQQQQQQQQHGPPHQQHHHPPPPPPQVKVSPDPRVPAATPLPRSRHAPLTPGVSECVQVRQQTLGFAAPPAVITPVVRPQQQAAAPQLLSREACMQPGGGGGGGGGALHHEPPLHPQVAPRRFRYRPSYKSAVSHDDEDEDEEEEEEEEATTRRGSTGGAWPLSPPLEGSMKALSSSSPCITESPAPPSGASSFSLEKNLPKILIQNEEGGALPPHDSGVELKGQWAGAGVEHAHVSPESTPMRFSRPDRYTPSPPGVREVSPHHAVHLQPEPRSRPGQGARLSSSHSGIFSPSSDAGFSSSCEDLRAGEAGRGNRIEDVLQRAQKTRLESAFHQSAERLHDNQDPQVRVLPWHLSTGDLYDDHEDAESSDGSSVSSPVRLRSAVSRRLSSRLRSRMCRSLGGDLDLLLQEEGKGGGGGGGGSELARLNRLQLISSSLSLHHNLSSSSLSSCSTPSRSHSAADLVEQEGPSGGRRSLPAAIPTSPSAAAQHEASSKQSLVPLEPREHTWLVKGAAGAWPDIYSLFRDDPSLLNKRDFISGFTVLHWISKHGDHRVLNTLWYGVQKAGLTFDVNARSTSGHTPLHIAAIHGNKNIMRLLVGKFDADVRLRDTAGKRPWQYLSCTAPLEIFQLLGAPARAALGGDGSGRRVDSSWEQQQQQRRRRRHHFSTASSGERPLTIAGTIRVKRSSSIAALLKHKSLRRFHAHKSDFLF